MKNVQDEQGNTPIHLSIIYGNFDLLELFIDVAQTIPYQNFINLKNAKQLTPLLIACQLNEIEVCEFLLEANADLTLTDSYGCNAIHVACRNKNLPLLKLLLKYVEKNCNYSPLNYINHEGYAPLHLSVLSESIDLVRELLYFKRLKINIPDRRAGLTALHYAASNFNLLPLCSLLVRNEQVEIDAKCFNGSTPLHMAIVNKNYLTVCLLISNGASLNLKNDMPVHFDVESYCFQSVSREKNKLLRQCVESVLKNRADMIKSENTTSSEESLVGDLEDSIGVKLSQEVKRVYDELDRQKIVISDSSSLKFSNSHDFQHNYDAFYYAQDDPWMLEIFKDCKSVEKRLLERILCFESFRKMYFEVEPMIAASRVNVSKVEDLMDMSKKRLKHLEKNISIGQVRLSQQETSFNENESFYAY